jgi:acetyltransferase-like isoleucine patch superfamily enzyme
MLTFEDGATVACLFQAHTFEDRVLKMDRIAIRRGATVGSHAVLLYGADIGANARVAPHSVVMKHEHLRAGLLYAGFPTRPQGDTKAW